MPAGMLATLLMCASNKHDNTNMMNSRDSNSLIGGPPALL